ncbi:hypothetical protein EUX98_g262 [Antrodiella citrinella]|uniref:DAGKc domain-containing protein n=1 Tax=Antrodiella citrinella TaxID=2447956 RepID=A0A4S4ND61_9APHY|nr:hypothetical protein EUX98_g262 [Antrodiella citrinella]
MASHTAGQQITITSKGRSSTLTLTDDSLRVQRQGEEWQDVQVPYRNVVWSEYVNGSLEISVLAKRGTRKKATKLVLVHLVTEVEEAQTEAVANFINTLTQHSYKGPQTPRRVKVLVNPHSGPGKAVQLFKQKVEPLFRAARCILDVTYTTSRGHATEIARDMSLDAYDAVAVMSGDGLVHEVLNGFAKHKDPMNALRIPIAQIPAGSGNGFSLNLLGLEEGADVSAAALNVVKGRPMKIDLFSFTQGDTRVLSFMSQCVGLMAELDIWTEHLSRFVVGYLTGLIRRRACPIKIQIKVAHLDKNEIYKTFKEARSRALEASSSDTIQPVPATEHSLIANGGSTVSSLPPLKYAGVDHEEDGWISVDKPTLFVYAGKGPYVSKDLMQFPTSLPDDGFIDVIVQERITRKQLLASMDGAVDGEHYWHPQVSVVPMLTRILNSQPSNAGTLL